MTKNDLQQTIDFWEAWINTGKPSTVEEITMYGSRSLEVCKQMQKQSKALAVKISGVNPDGTIRYSCPNCGRLFWDCNYVENFCPKCGSKLEVQPCATESPCDTCINAGWETTDRVAACNCCENYEFYQPDPRLINKAETGNPVTETKLVEIDHVKTKKWTQANHIHSMSNKKLAEFLMDLYGNNIEFDKMYCKGRYNDENCDCTREKEIVCICDWLESEVDE